MQTNLPALVYYENTYSIVTHTIEWKEDTIYMSHDTPVMDAYDAAHATFIPLSEIKTHFNLS